MYICVQSANNNIYKMWKHWNFCRCKINNGKTNKCFTTKLDSVNKIIADILLYALILQQNSLNNQKFEILSEIACNIYVQIMNVKFILIFTFLPNNNLTENKKAFIQQTVILYFQSNLIPHKTFSSFYFPLYIMVNCAKKKKIHISSLNTSTRCTLC